jgi:hypothetical protein
MIKFVLLGVGVVLLILGVGYILIFVFKVRNNHTITTAHKKGLLAAIGAAIVGFLLIYKNYQSKK